MFFVLKVNAVLIDLAGYIMSNFWFSVYNTISVKTHDDVISGFVSVLISVCWVSLGLYARKRALKLLRSPHIVPMIRLHARTVFKLNASLVLGSLLLAFVVLSNVSATRAWTDETCQTGECAVLLEYSWTLGRNIRVTPLLCLFLHKYRGHSIIVLVPPQM
jgi:hypothetical protein